MNPYPPYRPPFPTERQIKETARQRMQGQYWPLLGASALFLVPGFVVSLLTGTLLAGYPLLQILIRYGLAVLLFPLQVGCWRCFLFCWRGGGVPLREVGCYYRGGQLLRPALLIGLVSCGVQFAANLVATLLSQLPVASAATGNFYMMLYTPAMLVSAYFMYRLYPAPFCFILAPGRPARAILRDSMAFTKGRVRKLIGLGLSFMGWFFLAMGAVTVVAVVLVVVYREPFTGGIFLAQNVATLTLCLLGPYFYTSLAGLCDLLISTPRPGGQQG